jgi:hypothetical protein
MTKCLTDQRGSNEKIPSACHDIETKMALQIVDTCLSGNKDHFTKSDFVFIAVMRPNEDWTESRAEKELQSLVQEGVLEEFEPGRYNSRRRIGSAAEGGGNN